MNPGYVILDKNAAKLLNEVYLKVLYDRSIQQMHKWKSYPQVHRGSTHNRMKKGSDEFMVDCFRVDV